MLKWLIYAKHWKAGTGHTCLQQQLTEPTEKPFASSSWKGWWRKERKTGTAFAKLFVVHVNAIKVIE